MLVTRPPRKAVVGSGPNRSYFSRVLTLTVEMHPDLPPVPPTSSPPAKGVYAKTSHEAVLAAHAGVKVMASGRATADATAGLMTRFEIGLPRS